MATLVGHLFFLFFFPTIFPSHIFLYLILTFSVLYSPFSIFLFLLSVILYGTNNIYCHGGFISFYTGVFFFLSVNKKELSFKSGSLFFYIYK